jgi:hypothetical protein
MISAGSFAGVPDFFVKSKKKKQIFPGEASYVIICTGNMKKMIEYATGRSQGFAAFPSAICSL